MTRLGTTPRLLEQLVGRDHLRKFTHQLWPDVPLAMHGAVKRLKSLTAVPELRSLDALIAASRSSKNLIAWAPPPAVTRGDGRIAARVAARRYAAGFTLYFHGVEDHAPAVRELVTRLNTELGLAPGATSCLVFASARGSGAQPHIDANYVFNVQLRGTKRWTLAAGATAHPLAPTASGPGVVMPAQQQTVVARPGSVVFLPPGTWHATEADAESFAVAFAVDAKPWGGLVTDMLWDALSHDGDERRLDVTLTHRTPRAMLSRHLAATKKKLAAALSALDVDQLLAGVPDVDATFRHARGTTVALGTHVGPASAARVALNVRTRTDTQQTAIDPDLAAVLQWTLTRASSFSMGEALIDLPHLDARVVMDAFTALCRAGLFERLKGKRA